MVCLGKGENRRLNLLPMDHNNNDLGVYELVRFEERLSLIELINKWGRESGTRLGLGLFFSL